MPKLSDVANRARVSTATVSRCLNAPDRVVPETRERVMRAIKELAYTPHFGGRALASSKTNTIGAVIPTMENAIFARGLQAFEEELAASGYTLLVASTSYDPDREYQQVRTLVGRGADGILLIGWDRPAEVFDFLRQRDFPTVVAWNYREIEGVLCTGFDNRRAMREMVERVLSYGHTSIAMIAGITRHNDRAADRVAGVLDAAAQAGISETQMPVLEAAYTIEAGAAAMRDLATRSPRPTAIVCGNDVLAVGALREAKALGLRVPEDISIVGFDNIDLALVVDPQLTTVHVPHRRMGHAAARMLIGVLQGDENVASSHFETELVERGSLAAVPKMRKRPKPAKRR